jgi:hypothetical protein
MIAQLLETKPIFIIPVERLGEPFSFYVNSSSFLNDRRRVLEKCLDEDKWYLSKERHKDVGIGFAEEHFHRVHFPGFDDGFAAAYKHRSNVSLEPYEDKSCHFYWFFKKQAEEIQNLVLKYQSYLSYRLKREISYEDALQNFMDNYLNGFAVGFRAGFCGISCPRRRGCIEGDRYRYELEDFESDSGNDFY